MPYSRRYSVDDTVTLDGLIPIGPEQTNTNSTFREKASLISLLFLSQFPKKLTEV